MWGNFYCADLLKNVVYSIDTIQVFAGEKVESDFCRRGTWRGSVHEGLNLR